MVQLRREAGFTLLEVAIAGSIALAIIFSLFSAVRMANDQTVYVDKKRDEQNLLADLRYVLANGVLCSDRLQIPQNFTKDQELTLNLREGTDLKAGEKISLYGLKIDSFKILDTEQITEDRSMKSGSEHFEVRQHKLVQISPPPPKHAKGELMSWQKTYYMDIQLQASSIAKKSFHFRPERLARVNVLETWNPKEGLKVTCVSPGSQLTTTAVSPGDFGQRLGLEIDSKKNALTATGNQQMDSIVDALTHRIDRLDAQRKANEKLIVSIANQPGASSGGGSGSQPVSSGSVPSDSSDEKPAAIPAEADSSTVAFSATPSPAPAAAPAPAPALPPVKALEADGSCATNMTAAEAIAKGYPIVENGHSTEVALENCDAKRYRCVNGAFVDTGEPIFKRADCSRQFSLSAEEAARQLSARSPASR